MRNDVLIIEDHSAQLNTGLSSALQTDDLAVTRTHLSSFSPSHLASCRENLIVVSVVTKTNEALGLFDWLHHHPLQVPTLAILAADDPAFIRAAAGAVDDFLLWPLNGEELRHRIRRLIGPRSETVEEMQRALVGQVGLEKIVGTAPAFLRVLSRVAMVGASEGAVLLTGETGTGKELCARVIHLLSRRRNGPFVPVDCGGLPDHLFENELFGHVRGAFTDAHSEQKGLVALARNGTLLLDEIDSLSLAAQGKLLRLLQEQTFRPLGSEKFCQANVRVIAATNKDLPALVEEKRFRADLFFRLDVLRVRLPALRERPADIALLARHFMADIQNREGMARKTLSPATIRKLEAYSWPGNVRELFNTLHRALLCSPGTQILPAHIELDRASVPRREGRDEIDGDESSADFRSGKLHAIERFEKTYVERLLVKYAGNVTRAAREAGKERRAFGRLAKKYGLTVSA